MDNLHICCFCLTKNYLITITKEKEQLISSLLNRKLPVSVNNRICINCSYTLNCVDKFHKNSKVAEKILEERSITSQDQNNFLDVPTETQEKLSTGFEQISEWLTEVNVELRHISMKKGLEATKKVTNADVKDFIGPENLEDVVCEVSHVADEMEKEEKMILENDDLLISSSDESEEPTTLEMNEVTKESQKMETTMQEDEDFEKYRKKATNINRSYKCPECNNFYHRHELKYHFNVHKGLTPFKCVVQGCSKAYFSPTAVARHCRDFHKLKVTESKWTKNEQSGKTPVVRNSSKISKKKANK